MPTGAGKTLCFTELMKRFASDGRRSIMAVRGVKLLSQAAERLEREGVPYSVIQASDKRLDESLFITLASIDTLARRKLRPEADLIVIDEAHLANSDSFKWFLGQYPDAYILAVTATPWHPEGFRSMADVIVEGASVRELITQNYLVPARYFVPERPDLSHVKRSGDDYSLTDLNAAMNQARLFGPIVSNWLERGEGKPTLLFAVSIEHSRRLRDAFLAEGIAAEHVDGGYTRTERDDAERRLRAGVTKVVCSVGVYTTGVDFPSVENLILARPTLSPNLHFQILGRGSRPFPGKTHFKVFDHAGSIERHGFYEDPRPASLEGKPPAFNVVTRTCEKCFCTWLPTLDPRCPGLFPDGSRCGHVNEVKPSNHNRIDSDEAVSLVEVSPEELERRQLEKFVREASRDAAERGHKPGAAFYKIKSRYGDAIAKASWGLIHRAYKENDA